jgi:hypothetical protein
LSSFKHTAKLLQIHRFVSSLFHPPLHHLSGLLASFFQFFTSFDSSLFPDFGFVFPLLAEKIRVALIEFFFNTETQLQVTIKHLLLMSFSAC